MKNRTVSLVLALLLLISLPSQARADSSGICFTSVGDTLLELSSMAAFVGGSVYVPSRVFSSFGVYSNYFETDSTILLYKDSKQIYFEMSTGKSYDSLDNYYSASAVFRNGLVYVPVSWMCTYFGFSYSYISGTGNGDIVRIKNGGEVLTDSQFLDAASSLMKSRYNEYFGSVDPITPSPTPNPAPSPSPVSEDEHRDTYVFLAFTGAPDNELLDLLEKYSYSASFFITRQEAVDSGDILRRIYGTGHNVGVYCQSSPAEEFDAAADAIFSAVQISPTFISSPSSVSAACEEYSQAHGLANLVPYISVSESEQYTGAVTSSLEAASGYVSISIALGENSEKILPSVLHFLSSNHFTVLPLRETYL